MNNERVELHLHTAYSEMDGINYPADYIWRAAEWGHNAIAITDHGVAQGLPEAYRAAKKAGIKLILGMEGYLVDDGKYPDFMNMQPKDFKRHHVVILVKEDTSFDEGIPKEERVYGRRNLYELISHSHIHTYKNRPIIPKSLLVQKREGLIIGSACEQGEVYQAVLRNESEEEIERIAAFYNYLEIQPNCNNAFMINSKDSICSSIHSYDDLIEINEKIITVADKLGKPIVATSDTHFLEKEDAMARAVIMNARGFDNADNQPDLHFKSTAEMLEEFAWAGERAKEFVIDNPNKIAEMIMDNIPPIPHGFFPVTIENANEELEKACEKRLKKLYGNQPPYQARARLDRELEMITDHAFSSFFVIAMRLVQDSEKHGYPVGSRGAVASSFIAYLCGITKVNPLEPHYYCPHCYHTEFFTNGSAGSGFDLPAKNCPHCNTPLKRDGHEIPYETFLGFWGDKEPDIDLNFSDEYQLNIHQLVKEMFGEDKVCCASTVATVYYKMAARYVSEYIEKYGLEDHLSEFEKQDLIDRCSGIKRGSGRHPGSLIVIPDGYVMEDFTPVQYTANDKENGRLASHFACKPSYLDATLQKLDLLGHIIPTMLKKLEENTGVKADDIDVSDPKLYELLVSSEPLGIKLENVANYTGTLAINELGTPFVRNMLISTKPKSFSELIKVSGLSHGTDTWLGNAGNLVENGTFDFKSVPACRDDIYVYLLHKCKEYESKTGKNSPLSRLDCFKIMEYTRKGKSIYIDEYDEKLKEIGVAQWYIDSCKKIKYMFPKAHAVSYMIWALQLLWYKLYYPQEFYNAFFKCEGGNVYSEIANMNKDEIVQVICDDPECYHYYFVALEMLERGCYLE